MSNIPNCVIKKMDELKNLCEEHPQYLPLPKVAEFLGANAEGLRFSIESGKCPFGVMWQKTIGGNKAFKIPTAKFYFWFAGDYIRAFCYAEAENLKINS